MEKEAVAAKTCSISRNCGGQDFGRLFRHGLSQGLVCRADLMSVAVKKDAQEAERLIDKLLGDVRLPKL